jgi:hypothetical protein
VRNDAHVADDTLDEARRVVSDIYSQAGLTLVWCAEDCTVTIALRPRASNDTARRAPDAMGYTPGGGEARGRLAFVLINRVNKIADGYGTARSIVLGAAMAHELGHLLISKEHSKTGIMKATLNQSDFRKLRQGELRLTAEQARHIGAQTRPREPAGTDIGHPTMVLHIINYAALSLDVLDEAKARVASVYKVIGVRTVWVDSERSADQHQDGRLHLTILLLSRDMAEKKISAEGIKDGVLGQAHQPSGRASIFCERIGTMPGAPTYFPIPLGDVIAHEVGHLVLGSNSHSRSGIMRTHTNVHTIHLQTFDEAQARTIRTVLMKLAGTGR